MATHILIPHDGSDNAEAALEVAADLARTEHARLTILHVGLRQPDGLEEAYAEAERAFDKAEEAGGWTSDHPEWPRHEQILEHMGRRLLDAAKGRAEARGARSVDTLLDWGAAGERILHHARHLPADLVVMGSRGASALGGLFLGSVSHKVFHLAPCSCITVHAREGARGLGEVRHILMPFDGSSHARKALRLACELAQRFDALLQILHVPLHGVSAGQLRAAVDVAQLDEATREALDRSEIPPDMALAGAYPPLGLPPEALEACGREILADAERLARKEGVSALETGFEDGSADKTILEVAERDGADLIVMGSRGLGEVEGLLVGSVSYSVNHRAPCTCLVVR